MRLESTRLHFEYCVDCLYSAPPRFLPLTWLIHSKNHPLLPFSGHGWPLYTDFWAKVLQFPGLLSQGPVTGIVRFSLIIIIINCNIISRLHQTLRKSKLSFAFRLSLCLFLDRSLGFLESFSNCSPGLFLPPLMRSSLPPNYHENLLIWFNSILVVPHELSLVLSAFGHSSRGGASPLTVPIPIWSKWTWSGQSPLAFAVSPFENPFRPVHDFCILFHSAAIIHSFYDLVLHCSFFFDQLFLH